MAKEIEKASPREVNENLSHSGQSLNQGVWNKELVAALFIGKS